MACEVVRCQGGVFAVWGTPEAEDMDRVGNEIFDAARNNGGLAVYLARVPVGSPPPTDAAKRRFNQLFPELVKVLSSYHVVMEGSGFFAAFKRATLTTLLQPFWRRRLFHVHATCDEVLSQIDPDLLPIVTNLLQLAAARGFLLDERPGTRGS
jgi:hypothetical protein